MTPFNVVASVCVAIGLLAGTAFAANIETVPVGNLRNDGEWSGESYGGYGPDRICGAVDYAYHIGKYEVTAGQYCEFLNKMAGVDSYSLYNTTMSRTDYGSGIARSGGGTVGNPYTYSVDAAFVNRPVNYVSYWDACRFANWLHNGQPTGQQGAGTTETGAYTLNGYNEIGGGTIQRNTDWKWAITSEDEWYKAAYHKNDGVTGNYWDYPTASDTVPGRDMTDAFGNNANYRTGSGPYPIDAPYYTTVGGEFQNSGSCYGTFDQGGNLWEWNEAALTVSVRGIRGGAFNDYGGLHASNRGGSNATTEAVNTGFRVVEVPEPATIAMLALGCVGVLRRKRT